MHLTFRSRRKRRRRMKSLGGKTAERQEEENLPNPRQQPGSGPNPRQQLGSEPNPRSRSSSGPNPRKRPGSGPNLRPPPRRRGDLQEEEEETSCHAIRLLMETSQTWIQLRTVQDLLWLQTFWGLNVFRLKVLLWRTSEDILPGFSSIFPSTLTGCPVSAEEKASPQHVAATSMLQRGVLRLMCLLVVLVSADQITF
ncbi:uncharacterized protein FYW61_011847 [Anableps anableps]